MVYHQIKRTMQAVFIATLLVAGFHLQSAQPTIASQLNQTTNVSSFVILGQEGVWIQASSFINSGNIGSNAVSSGPYLRASSEVTLDSGVKVLNSSIFGDTLTFRSGVQVKNAYGNRITGGQIFNEKRKPTLPFTALPLFPHFTAGDENVRATKTAPLTLDSGSYGTLLANGYSRVTFTGGVYTFAAWDVRHNVTITFAAPTEIRITGRLKTNSYTQLVPGAGVNPNQVIIYVAGGNSTSDPNTLPIAAFIGSSNIVRANVYALNGSLRLNNDTQATGAFIGKWVRIGQRVQLNHSSLFGSSFDFTTYNRTRPTTPTTTPIPATQTPIPTTQTPVPTTTPIPATQTPIPTTQTPVPTTTPIPATQTPIPTTQTPVPTSQPHGQLVYSTDFEGVSATSASKLSLPISHDFEFGGNGGSRMWVEKSFAHSGSQSIGMELFDIKKSRRNEFNIYNMHTLAGDEVTLSVWLYIPSDFNLHVPGIDWNWTEFLVLYSENHPPNHHPYLRLTLTQPDIKKQRFNLSLGGRDSSGASYKWGHVNNFPIPLGQWFNVRYYLKRDTVNGAAKVWVNEDLIFDVKNVPTKVRGELGYKATIAKLYYETGETVPHKIWVDDLQIYRGYVASDQVTFASASNSSFAPSSLMVDATPVPMVAAFAGDVLTGTAPLTVNFTNQSMGEIQHYGWDFGDGTTSTEINPSRTFTVPGEYQVKLMVSNADGAVQTAETTISVNAPPPTAAFIASTTEGVAPATISFTNQSTGDIANMLWDFGDGTTTSEVNPVHTYAVAGMYSVSITVTGKDGSTRTAHTTINVNTPIVPVTALFASNVVEGQVPLTVQFSNQSTGDIQSYEWQFGDGATSSETHPAYTFNHSGQYTVVLTVTGQDGTTQAIQTTINAIAPAPVYVSPVAAFAASVVEGQAPLAVQFTNQSSGDVQSYTWQFGDGATSSEANPVYVFNNPGQYTVVLTVTGMDGSQQTAQTLINVQAQTPAVNIPAECQWISFAGAPIVGSPDADDWLYGTEGNDLIIAGSGHNEIYAGGGDDCIVASDGNDILYGGAGNDVLIGGNGSDAYYGEDGHDSAQDYDPNSDWMYDSIEG